MSALRLRLVVSRRANLFMTELLEVVATGAREAGADAEVSVDGFPPAERDTVNVVVPHETFPLLDVQPTPAQLAQTVALCVEQPGTIWFNIAAEHVLRCGAAVDISRVGVAGLRAGGIHARHLQLGYSPALDGWGGDPARGRPIDVLYMGSAAPRREKLLASYADVLARHNTTLMIPPHWAKTEERPDFLVGAAKRERIASAKLLLSVRRQPEAYFEWVRALDAIANGSVFLCDHGAGFEPLVPSEHFVSADAEGLHLVADALLRDTTEIERIRDRAYDFIRQELRLADGVRTLLEVADELRGAGHGSAAALRETTLEAARPAGPQEPPGRSDDPEAAEKAMEALLGRRRRAREQAIAAGQDPDALDEVHRTPSYDVCDPVVSVCIPAYEASAVLANALASVASQDFIPLEVLVHDDASSQPDAEIAASWLRDHPWVAGLVVRRATNAGLPAGRNTMARLARAPFVLMLDADNELLTPCLSRLVDALNDDRKATFAYPILAAHRDGTPDGLLSYLAWDPALLAAFNPIDALALLRRDDLLALGGYSEDPRLHGWEDYELWCRCAAHDRHGVHVPQILARYRRTASSMLSVTDLDQGGRMALLRELHPTVMAGPASSRRD